MSEQKNRYDVPIEGHDYDGIQELDNQLPRWWIQLFYLSIVFAIGYFSYYHIGPGRGVAEEFEREQAQAQILRAQSGGGAGAADGLPGADQLLQAFKDDSVKAKGKEVFTSKCVSCHGPQGQGNIGPNLTDEYWIHGGTLPEIAKTVTTGVLEKGMPPWGPVLKKEELVAVVAYVKSLKGTNPPNPKKPEGVLVKE